MARTVRILSIDGGGIRGIIPALVLVEIERLTGKPISRLFDLIAGTSAGGIIALALTRPDERGRPLFTAEDVVQVFEKDGSRIFQRSIFQTFNTLDGLLDEKYPSTGIKKVLKKYLGGSHLTDALTNVLITAYEIERRNSFFFKSHKAKKEDKRNFLMRQAALATSAAPTYFEPAVIPTADLSEYYALVDGGVFANNPAMCAFVEAKTLFPEAQNFFMVSLGTGLYVRPIPVQRARNWGMAHWAEPILDVVFDGISDTVDYQLKQLLPGSYYRIQTKLDKGDDKLDNARPENIRMMKLLAEELIREQYDKLNLISSQLV